MAINPQSGTPLTEQVKGDLKFKITSGVYAPGSKLGSEDTLAAEYGISRMTVRHAVIELVNEGFLHRVSGKGTYVSEIAAWHHGHPATGAATSAGRRCLAILMPSIDISFLASLLIGAQGTASRAGYNLVVELYDSDPYAEREFLQRQENREFAGLVHVCAPISLANQAWQLRAAAAAPLVTVDMVVPGLPGDCVVSDDASGAALATRHLLETGHERILHLAGPAGTTSGDQRVAGFLAELAKHQIALEQCPVRRTHWNMIEAYSETKKVFLSTPPELWPTAIFAAQDGLALGAYRALTELNLAVPGKVALAGYGNLDIGELMIPGLTSVDQQPLRIGQRAVELMLEKLDGRRPLTAASVETLPTRLIIRESCGIRNAILLPPPAGAIAP